MVSTRFINAILESHQVKQKELAKEWSKFYGKGKKYQSHLSARLKNDTYIDSISFIKALSKLTGIAVEDLIYEVAATDSQVVFSSVQEPHEDYDTKEDVCIPVGDLKTMASGLLGNRNDVCVPKSWVGPGAHKIVPVFDEGMSPTIIPGDLLVFKLVDRSDWAEMLLGDHSADGLWSP